MIKREIIKNLEKWKVNGVHRAFILDGARQTGKTFILDYFCKNNFKECLYINLAVGIQSVEYLRSCKSTKDYLSIFSVIADKILESNETVIFIDEVQILPEIITAIKFLVIDGRYRYILAGSTLGLAMHSTSSIPVGYAEYHKLYPVSFYEYLQSNSVSDDIISEVSELIKQRKEIPDPYFAVFNNKFKEYLLTGGYPKVIEAYLKEHNLKCLFDELTYTQNLNLDDLRKYEKINKNPMLRELYLNIPSQLNKEYNRFYLNDLKEGIKYFQIEKSLLWITEAGYVYKVNMINDLSNGLLETKKESFKLYLNDIGILGSIQGIKHQMGIFTNKEDVNYNAIYENYVCQELTNQGNILYYYKTKKYGEVEFVYYDSGFSEIIATKVKYGKDYIKHSSLDYLKDTFERVGRAIVLSNCNVRQDGKIIYLPIWAVSLYPVIINNELENLINKDKA